MVKEFAYQFSSSTNASRFLAELQSGFLTKVKSKSRRYKSDHQIYVSYVFDSELEFDDSAQQLDDLAAQYEGYEISV